MHLRLVDIFFNILRYLRFQKRSFGIFVHLIKFQQISFDFKLTTAKIKVTSMRVLQIFAMQGPWNRRTQNCSPISVQPVHRAKLGMHYKQFLLLQKRFLTSPCRFCALKADSLCVMATTVG